MADDHLPLRPEMVITAGSMDVAFRVARMQRCDFAVLEMSPLGDVPFGVADALRSRGTPYVAKASDRSGVNVPPIVVQVLKLKKPIDDGALSDWLSHLLG